MFRMLVETIVTGAGRTLVLEPQGLFTGPQIALWNQHTTSYLGPYW